MVGDEVEACIGDGGQRLLDPVEAGCAEPVRVVVLTPAGQRLVREVMQRRRTELVSLVDAMPASWLRPVTAAPRSLSKAVGEPPETEWWLGWADAPEAEAS